MSKRAPSTRWRTQHGTKIIHRWRFTAVLHEWSLNRRKIDWQGEGKKVEVYPCWWGQWYYNGETAKKHWHVGRRGKYTGRTSESYLDASEDRIHE